MQNNQPYQKYVDAGYFRTIESSYTTPDGSTHVSIKTVVYQRGLNFIRKVVS
jgi:anti-repressor protein